MTCDHEIPSRSYFGTNHQLQNSIPRYAVSPDSWVLPLAKFGALSVDEKQGAFSFSPA